MQKKFLLSGKMLTVGVALALGTVACHTNDYETSDTTEQTTVSPSHDVHMTPSQNMNMPIDSMHLNMDSAHGAMKDTTSVEDSTGHGHQ